MEREERNTIEEALARKLRREFDLSVRRNSRYVGRKVEQLDRVTRVTGPSPAGIDNVIPWSDLTAENADRVIEEQIRHFSELGHAFEWILYSHDEPRDLRERLDARGFQPESEEEVVVAPSLEIGSIDAVLEGIELRPVRTPRGVDDVVKIGDEVWGPANHDFLIRWLNDLIADHPEDSLIIVAYDGEQAVGAAWCTMWPDRVFAPLFGGTVLPEWRRRGVYRAMVAERAKKIADKGIEWCSVDAGPESHPILVKLGFRSLTRRFSLCRAPDGS